MINERDLVAAMIQLAWQDLRRKDKDRQHLVEDARRWLSSRSDHAGSFVWCCEVLGWDIESVRARILNGEPARTVRKHRKAA